MKHINILLLFLLIASCSDNDIDIVTQQKINKNQNNSQASKFGEAVYGESNYE